MGPIPQSSEIAGDKTNRDMREVIKILEDKVNALYRFRDEYFSSRPKEAARCKWEEVEAELDRVVVAFERTETMEPNERAFYLYLLGKALNVTREYKREAEEVLVKAVKLDSKSYRAWNELGETYWKKSDLNEAKNCFLGAIEQENNKESLRNLSILMRTRECWNILEGLKYAKEAVELDPKDGKSWLVLGNAYTSFYGTKRNPDVLDMCKTAYDIAARDERLGNDPYLHYNRGIVEKFRDDYGAAILSFEKAAELDPTWDEPENEKCGLIDYLDKAQSFVDEKGKLKGKKLKKLLKAINPGFHSGKNRSKKPVLFSELKPDKNRGKIVTGIVAATFRDESRFNLILIDPRESCVVANLYNLSEEKGILVGSVAAIADPHLNRIRIFGESGNYSFDAIRIENPSNVTVNGKAISGTTRNLYFTATTLPD